MLLSREPHVVEGPKKTLFFNGRKTSETVRKFLNDIYDIKKPDAFKLRHSNDITIFEDATRVEQFCKKYETPLFLMGSHSKKRPNNVVIGRIFNYSLLDMFELGIDKFESIKDFPGPKITLGTKPCLIFNGPEWDQSDELKELRSIFVDFFHREEVNSVRLQGLEHAISFTISPEGKILFRSYKIHLKKSGCRTPRIELEEIGLCDCSLLFCLLRVTSFLGPRVDFAVRRNKLASEDLMKQACRKPKELKITQKKNISVDDLGTKHGRIHMGKQEINKIQTRKMKGLKKTPEERKELRRAKKRPSVTETIISTFKKQKVE